MIINRRDFLKASAGAAAVAGLYGCTSGSKASGHVVVVGGGVLLFLRKRKNDDDE